MNIRLPTAQFFSVWNCPAAAGLGAQAEPVEVRTSLASRHQHTVRWKCEPGPRPRAGFHPQDLRPGSAWLSGIRLKGPLPIPAKRESGYTEHRPAAHRGSSEKFCLMLNSWSAFSHGPARLLALDALFDLSSHIWLFIRRPGLCPVFSSSRIERPNRTMGNRLLN